MTKKLFRTLKITCLCMALTAALPIVSFADETTAAVKEDKMVVRIIHLDENGNPLEEDKQKQRVLKRRQIKKKQMLMRQTPMRRKRLRQKPTRQRQNLRQLSKLRMISVPKLLHMRSSS